MNLEKSVSSWYATRSHDEPISSTDYIVYVCMKSSGSTLASGFSARKAAEVPRFETDSELFHSDFYLKMVEEATEVACQALDKIVAEINKK